jgi:hypothetical protein
MDLHKCFLYEEYDENINSINKYQKRIFVPEYDIVIKFNNINAYYELEFIKNINTRLTRNLKIIYLNKKFIENLENKNLNKSFSKFNL